MANLIVIGTQWGDEGKGKIIDLVTPSFDVVARYQGGHNAGHTVSLQGQKIVLHLIPTGILHPQKLCLIGNGVVLDPQSFLDEISTLQSTGVHINDNLAISKKAHLILPYHSQIEKVEEMRRGKGKIGTTCRGIGPSYTDKAARCGIRVGDVLNLAELKGKIQENVKKKNLYLSHFGGPSLDAEKTFKIAKDYASKISSYIKDVSLILDEQIQKGKSILFEGAQGTLLDVDHGTYPYVTSSNCTTGGVCTGLGIGPDKIDGVLGVTKAYTTRVGRGPFPTEIFEEEGDRLLKRGNEFGATTGRPRRCGWFDSVAVAYSCRINGIKKMALTKPDVLDGLEEIKVCVGYKYKGERLRTFPTEKWVLEKVVPQYKKIKGWKKPVHGIRDFHRLPQNFRDYMRLIEDLTQTNISLVSTGMDRTDTLIIENQLDRMVNIQKIMENYHT
ncbi:adenylosuccinate synthase [bacterium]|nr:adenylosuccinate synthase [bacterium]